MILTLFLLLPTTTLVSQDITNDDSKPSHVQAYVEEVLYSFGGSPDGATPLNVDMHLDGEGNLYGTTAYGGLSCSDIESGGCGTVFEIDKNGIETVLYRFVGSPSDGSAPPGGLLRDAFGNIYGMTGLGGPSCQEAHKACGVVFKLDSSFKETVMHSFSGLADGGLPPAGVIMDSQGNFYGTLEIGGAYGSGAAFKLDNNNNATLLHSFAGAPNDGADPVSMLVQDGLGNLYGVTQIGGNGICSGYSCGTIFKIDANGKETVFYNFTGANGDGAEPYGGLALDGQGNLYGTTTSGGDLGCSPPYGCGTVFKFDKNGKETLLYKFKGAINLDGSEPYGNLMRDPQGNLYGTTFSGGDGCGTVFKLTPSPPICKSSLCNKSQIVWTETVLYRFVCSGGDGSFPLGGLVRDSQGNLFGTTANGGIFGLGTVFKLSPVQ
jgi:uncharacterized repeat protein (TIGR03803 family)